MTIKLVATDMDGTFLDSKGQFDMDRLKQVWLASKKKACICRSQRARPLVAGKLFEEVRNEIIFIAETAA